ncbi:hypothetical protein Pla52n_27340 [Stieleria varia]|uniref:Ternary complex associated domain-containing protein n=2 Tax=Stieleria varia TaxID=2528005 RepID=A0A5C6AZZ1_9BACT|nr:hypothetical protein Pla52n_27340 [Stieleria varia]
MRAFRTAISKQGLAATETELYGICNSLLRSAFPDATVFVLDRLGGFDQSKLQHVLTVEVFQDIPAALKQTPLHELPENSHQAHVIKIGIQKNLDDEVRGWKAICPHGLHHDSTLLPLYDLPAVVEDTSGAQWGAVMYANATRTIGDGKVSTLESVTLNACLHGLPKYQDVATCIRRVLSRMEDHVYRRSREVSLETLSPEMLLGHLCHAPFNDPIAKPNDPTALQQSKLGWSFRLWQTQVENLRVVRDTSRCLYQLHSDLQRHGDSLAPRNPIDDLQDLIRTMLAIANDEFTESAPSAMNLDQLAGWLPSLIRGCAHGDLHGRNVLVGCYRDDVDNPTVFDYELSRSDLLIGWDFVKLECELKSRCLITMYEKHDMQGFIAAVYAFEQKLAEKTAETRNVSWHQLLSLPADTPESRLQHLLLAIRQEAAHSLDRDDRRGEWYQEYLMLQLIYGVSTVRYQQSPRMKTAVYIGASVAASRSRWTRLLTQWDASRFEIIRDRSQSDDWQMPQPLIGWRAGCEVAKAWIATNDPQRHADAERLLRELIAEFPHAEELWEHLAFALLQLGRVDDAKKCLNDALRQFEVHTEELLCRLGRIEKDEAHKHFHAERWSAAMSHFEASFRHYSDAEHLERGHYPAINKAATRLYVAACLKHLGQPTHAERDLEIARTIARDLIETFPTWRPVTAEDELWHLATVAEAHAIAGNDAQADQYYDAALQHKLIQPSSRESITRQRERNAELIRHCAG